MPPLTIPANLGESAAADGDRRRWLDHLPDAVEELAARWSLTVGPPYAPGGSCAWVAPARDPEGTPLVLKVAWAHEESMHEADALACWDGNGAVRLHAEERFEDTVALLLERCTPGYVLADRAPEPEQDEVVVGLLERLWITPARPHPFRDLALMCDRWADSFEAADDRRPGAIDPGLAAEGIHLLRSLPRSASRRVLLCTDLHAQNILAAEREPWLAIDPKPYLGDPAYDLVQHMLNCRRLPDDPRALAHRLADLAGLDRERVAAWLLARCVQECIETPRLAAIAEALGGERGR